jgi:hypothetical protein
MLPRSEIIPAEFYQPYLDLVKEEDIQKALEKNTRQFRKFLKKIPRKKIDYAYAEGKWTIREMLQHIIDAERVFAYRAVTFSRLDANPLPGFDENTWAANSGASERSWNDLQEEWAAIRKATILLYDSLTDHQLGFRGQANGRPLNAFTIGYIIPGHVAHHMRILKERYL